MIASRASVAVTVAALALASGPMLRAQRVLATLEHTGVHDERIVDTDGDGILELLLVQTASPPGETALLRFALDRATSAFTARGRIAFDDPAHTLIATADILDGPGDEIVVADPRGIACRGWQREGEEPPPPVVLVRRARFTLRVDSPQISPFVMDLNEDGRLDLMLPTPRGVLPFLDEGPDPADRDGARGTPRFRAMELVPVPVGVAVDPGGTGLDPELTGSVRVPQIETEDLNGDGRPDMLTREGTVHRFHLQGEDGVFSPPIEVDIDTFEDSTPKAAMELGSTAVLGDQRLLQRGDIDGDGIPDHVIAHRRKIWTFLADHNGPQFTKARTQAVADDVTAMLVIDIDEDDRADLLTFRVQLPGVGTLLLGLVRSIDIDIKAVGYASDGTGFERIPKWRRTVTLRVPAILTLLSQQDELLERFSGLIQKTRITARGHLLGSELLGNDTLDLAVVSADGRNLDLCAGAGPAPTMSSREGRRMMRKLVFEDDNTVFDIDRIFDLLAGLLDSMTARTLGTAPKAATLALRDPDHWQLANLLIGDLDDRPGDELLAVYHATTDPTLRAYDAITWR